MAVFNTIAKPLIIDVRSPETIYYVGEAEGLSSVNEKGIFDVLSLHENFISLIRERIVIHQKIGQSKEIKIENGIVKVFKNKVYVLVGIETLGI